MMSNDRLPSNVHVLKPRKMSLSDRLDLFLDRHALTPEDAPVRRDPTRPKTPGINAIECSSCGQAEYLTREHCRCGHYLRGQLEDEFLAWVRQLTEEHERLAENVGLKVSKLRYLYLIGLPFVAVPMLFLAFISEGLSLMPMVWMALGIAVMGVCAGMEQRLQKTVEASQRFLIALSLETFLEQRAIFPCAHIQRTWLGHAQGLQND
ncbi:hypothetical protein ACG74X_18995 [Marivita sp. S0852]|uniref:hypothetical protein n=1 Tax=Marivita sp. S0852 TaxID=3373893 RepID=UPI003981EA8D